MTAAQAAGAAAEESAADFLERNGLAIVARNFRLRSSDHFGGGAESIGPRKQARIVAAARQYLSNLRREPPCRFDVVTLDSGRPEWMRAAFEVGYR